MAKVRVYELAKEFKMDSKKLVKKLVIGGINIKNYMSTLDEAAVLKARQIVDGVVSEVVEEKRVKPTIIRRRKKIKIEEKPPVAETEEIVGEKTVISEPQVAVTEEKEKVVTPVEEPVKETEEKEAREIPEEIRTAPPEKEIKPEPQAEEAAPKEVIDVPAIEVPAKEEVSPAPKIKGRPKKVKGKKSDQPAKIIMRAEEGPLKNIFLKEKTPVQVKPAVSKKLQPKKSQPKATEATEKRKKGKLPKKAKKTEEIHEILQRRDLRRLKKEVYEKADLYKDRPSKRRPKRGAKKPKEAARKGEATKLTVPKAIKRRIKVQELVTVAELAKAMGIKAVELIRKLLKAGVMVNINQSIDYETAAVVADDFGFELRLDTFEEEHLIQETEDRPEELVERPPVVTIMGHVDHGKTSLLDYIRKSNIIGAESGGITQHIGAYYVKTDEGNIVFLDTPGHEAFTAMRARGARITDLIVLVVAADDGVMPQTREAINHARAAEIPIVVAVNKIDKSNANPEKVTRELAELDLVPEKWGGETLFAHISAKTGEGVNELLNLILLQSEMLDLKGNPKKPATGTVIEAKLDQSKGSIATVLIKNGSLRIGDPFICGGHYGRVRGMLNHRGKKMDIAGPSMPVEIYGISGVPMAGDEFVVVKDEKSAKQIIEYRKSKTDKIKPEKAGITTLSDFYEMMKEGKVAELNIVLKTDVQGSLEALSESLNKQSTDEVKVNIIHPATGAITESDVMLASASNAIIIGFNVRPNLRVSEIADKEKVDIRYYDVIYNVIEDIRLAMAGLLAPTYKENVIGRADIREIFHVPRIGVVAGSYVTNGLIKRNANARLLRDSVVIFDGKIASLRRFKDDVKEVQTGYEFGIGLENFNDIKPGDTIEVYEIEEIEAELS